jgi:SAM-dependent methyltransferase
MKIEEVYEIYQNFVKINYTEEYKNRYNTLPLNFNNKKWKWEGKDFPRVIALLEFKNYMEKYNFLFDDVLSFNGSSDPEYEYLKYNKISNYNYEDNKINNDLHNLNLDKKDFDFAMINQTIEHLYDPLRVIENIYSHLKKDGIFYANVPSNNIPHSTPEHYYTGITPVGLGVIVKNAGFKILEIGQWGNKDYLNILFNNGWSDYTKSNGYNDINCPIITWILAKK